MSDSHTPQWLHDLFNKQKDEILNALSKQNSKNPSKKQKLEEADNEVIEEEEEEEGIEEDTDSEDEFDRKYGHLIGPSTEDNSTKAQTTPSSNDPNDSDASVDEDLLDISDRVPNWDTSSSLKKFIKGNIDRPLSE